MPYFTLPTLFKFKNNKTQSWFIEVVCNDIDAYIKTVYGYVGGSLQESTTVITEGKNLGKANETTPYQQAVSEAESKWNKQKDKGYAEVLSDEVNLFPLPMLAKKIEDQEKNVKYPCYIQPKLDGIRCLARKVDGVIHVYSRLGKHFKVIDHIKESLKYLPEDTILDGELYVHNENFQDIISAVKRDTPSEDSSKVEYHVYDCVCVKNMDMPFWHRHALLSSLDIFNQFVLLVETTSTNNREGIDAAHKTYTNDGYEGVMVRGNGAYTHDKRSSSLLKVKKWQDKEYEIIGVKEGKGKAAKKAIFECVTPLGNTFDVVPEGSDEVRTRYWNERDSLIGKMLTVKFFSYTKNSDKPRFPVGKTIRDYE